MNIRPRLLPYAGLLESRSTADIDLLVIHCTELPDLAAAREYGERIQYPESGTGNSGHYYVDRDGSVEIWVPENRVAHHVRGFNERSIGIELVNLGRFPDWYHSGRQSMPEAYAQAQVHSLIALIAALAVRLPELKLIAGHQDLDAGTVPASDDPERMVRRKLDPGEGFPWNEVLTASTLERFLPGDARNES